MLDHLSFYFVNQRPLTSRRCNELAQVLDVNLRLYPFNTRVSLWEHLIGLLEKVDIRLSGIATTLSYDDKLVFVKVVISTMQFGMWAMKLLLAFLDHVENSTRNFQ